MLEALATALLLGGINTLADYASAELKLQSRPIYVFLRVLLACYCVGAVVGARSRQLMIGMLGGLMIGAFVAGVYYLLTPILGWGAVAAAWTLFWVAFSALETIFLGGSVVGAILQGVIAAALSGGLFYSVSGIWPAAASQDPNLWRALVLWFVPLAPGFIVLFWHKL